MAIAYFICIIVALVVLVAIFGGNGCGGNCNQGRTKCDCKKYF